MRVHSTQNRLLVRDAFSGNLRAAHILTIWVSSCSPYNLRVVSSHQTVEFWTTSSSQTYYHRLKICILSGALTIANSLTGTLTRRLVRLHVVRTDNVVNAILHRAL